MANIGIVDEDQSPLSARIADAFLPPYFLPSAMITPAEMDTWTEIAQMARSGTNNAAPSPTLGQPKPVSGG